MEEWNEYKKAGCRWAGGKYVIPNYKQVNAHGSRFSTFEELKVAYPNPNDTVNSAHVEKAIRNAQESVLACKQKGNPKKTKGMHYKCLIIL